jgi:AcrR family transcriptional regulator
MPKQSSARPAAAPSKRRPRRAARKKADVLVGARRVVARLGADATRFNDVAAETGTAVSTLQYSFGNRADLILATLQRSSEVDLERMRAVLDRHADSVSQLRAIVRESLLGSGEDEARESWLVWVEYWRTAARDDEVRQEWWDFYDEWAALIVETLRAGAADGAFTLTGDGADEARLVLALLDGFGLPVVLRHSALDRSAAAGHVLRTLATVLDCEALVA